MSHFAREIDEQPDVFARLIAAERDNAAAIAQRMTRLGPNYILIAARGSSDNAARYAQYLFGALLRLPVALAAPSLFTHGGPEPRLKGALVVGISQSGQSPDIVAVLAAARRQGPLAIAITNDTASPLAQQADEIKSLHAGPEHSVGATKTYVASLVALALIAASAGDGARRQAYLDALAGLPDLLKIAIEQARAPVAALVERWPARDRAAIIGRGFQFATAHEIALKLKKLTQIAAEPYSPADFRHGPVAVVEPNYPAMVIDGAADTTMSAVLADLRTAGANVVSIGGAESDVPVPAPTHPWLAPMTTVIGGQLLVLALATHLGKDIDAPRGLRKVTRTR